VLLSGVRVHHKRSVSLSFPTPPRSFEAVDCGLKSAKQKPALREESGLLADAANRRVSDPLHQLDNYAPDRRGRKDQAAGAFQGLRG